MNTECAREMINVTRNGFGVEISRTSTCIEWRKVPSGLYARPDLYNAKLELERIHEATALRMAMELMTDPNPFGNSITYFEGIFGV